MGQLIILERGSLAVTWEMTTLDLSSAIKAIESSMLFSGDAITTITTIMVELRVYSSR